MEVIIFSRFETTRNKLKQLTDDVISEKGLRIMSPHTSNPETSEALEKLIKSDKGYIVVIDVTEIKDWEKTVSEISEKCRRIKFCIISNSADDAAKAINTDINMCMCGYIDRSKPGFETRFKDMLVRIYNRRTTVCGGIMTFDNKGALKVIKFSDIYYIETIKQQHRCTIYHKNGKDVIRADISKLIRQLDGRFEVTRASTIANLSAAKMLYDKTIYFDDDLCCSVANTKQGKIKEIMLENVISNA